MFRTRERVALATGRTAPDSHLLTRLEYQSTVVSDGNDWREM